MYKRLVSALYVINIMAQSIITLVTPAALMLLFAYLLVEKCALPSWIYAPFIAVGFLSGLISMIRFAIRASDGLTRLEEERASRVRRKDNKDKYEEK